jgi:uncharacterized SAM-binding protein YcdF (DUF218 family)
LLFGNVGSEWRRRPNQDRVEGSIFGLWTFKRPQRRLAGWGVDFKTPCGSFWRSVGRIAASEVALGWFFPLSKTFAFLALPSHVMLWLVAATVLTLLAGWTRTARGVGLAALVLFVLIGVVPSGLMAAKPLEDIYPRRSLPDRIDGIVTLGAGLGVPALISRGSPGSSSSIDRLVSTWELARQHPEARVVFSGGWGEYSDAIAARADLLRMGLGPSRLTLEGRSRNTYENLAFTQAMVRPRPGETWVLATSAIQLPRAMRVAERLGWPVIPWPTDYRTTANGLPLSGDWFRIGKNLELADEAAHEWIGLAAYTAAGLAGKGHLHPNR